MQRLIIFLFCISFDAFSGLWLEPYLGLAVGSHDYQLSNYTGSDASRNGEYSANFAGTRYGLKIGFSVPIVAFGVHFEGGNAKHSSSDSKSPSGGQTPSEKDSFDVNYFGLFGTFHPLPLINLSGSVFLASRWEDNNGSNSGDVYSGKGFSFEMAFKLLPLVSFNLNYRLVTLNKFESATSEIDLPSNQISEHDISEVLLGISVPLDI